MPSLLQGKRKEVPNGMRLDELVNDSNVQGWSDKIPIESTPTPQRGTLQNHDNVDRTSKGTLSINGTSISSRSINPEMQSTMNGRLSESSRSENSSRLSSEIGTAGKGMHTVKRKEVPNGNSVTPRPQNQEPGAATRLFETPQPSTPLSSPSKASTRHRRAQSASNPGSPASSPLRADYPRLEPSQTVSQFPPTSQQDPGPNSSSLSLQRPGSLRLSHRHTLQVPKLPNTRGSRDFSFQYGNASEEAMTTGLATHGGRRPSLNLTRRATRSIHSDMHLDEIPQDADAARWAETVRQKRASRRRKREEEEDDRVMVGTKVDQNHVNYVTAYNMLTGIRFTVSRTNAKMDRELTDADFEAKHKFSFDITGNELTPSAKYDFKFKDYAPWVFRHLRTTFHLDPADYLISLTSKYILSELGSPGKSGSFFYFSRDYKYIIKTIHQAEHKLLRKVLRDYYAHVQANPNTLISQFYGLHRVKIPYGRKIHFVVMNNLFPPHRDIHQTFDLKGSTIGRELKEEDLEKNPRATLKDLNWLRRSNHLEFGPVKKKLFIEQMERDVVLLQKLKIMDYSLLVGIHDLERGNDENLRDKTLKVFQPGGDRSEEPQNSGLVRTPSKMENAQKARELRQIIQRERPVPMNQSKLQMPEEAVQRRKRSLFYSDDGGFRATHESGDPGEEIYYLGIIDCLTHVRNGIYYQRFELTYRSTASSNASSISGKECPPIKLKFPPYHHKATEIASSNSSAASQCLAKNRKRKPQRGQSRKCNNSTGRPQYADPQICTVPSVKPLKSVRTAASPACRQTKSSTKQSTKRTVRAPRTKI